jgi:plasmid stabilization system protein ParE
MSYTVVWKPASEEELARLWTNAEAAPNSIAEAADTIDRLLKTNPLAQGESRSGAVRVLFIDPLGVFFHVDDEDRLVSVVRVWLVA